VGIASFAFWRAEADRWPLWLPVALGLGAGAYFALPVEPGVLWGWAAVVCALVIAVSGRKYAGPALLAALLLGFGLAKLREERVATPVLDHPLIAHLTGRIVSLEPRAKGIRLILSDVRSGAFGLSPPRRVRLALQNGGAIPATG
jgi:competence protein ComEC